MIPLISTITYAVVSFVIIFVMKGVTNKRLSSIQPCNNSDEIINVKPYKKDWVSIVFDLVVIGLSALCGYIVSKNAVSCLAIVQLGTCYFASLAAAIIDLKTRTIPNFIPISLLLARALVFIYEIIFTDSTLSYLVSSLIGCFLCALLLIIANKISKGGIGGGDIKLLSCIGLMCGVYVVFSTLLLSLLACIVISIFLLLLKKKTSKDHLPFGPFIYIGLSVMCLFTLY
mgnify:FL=1